MDGQTWQVIQTAGALGFAVWVIWQWLAGNLHSEASVQRERDGYERTITQITAESERERERCRHLEAQRDTTLLLANRMMAHLERVAPGTRNEA